MSVLSTLLSVTEAGVWHLGIGDPTPAGWLTVGVYALAAALSWRASRRASAEADIDPSAGREASFWRLLALGLLLLGINKQLDLQTLFTEVARQLAHAQGWYEERRRYQRIFIAGIGLLGVLSAALGALWLRRVIARVQCVPWPQADTASESPRSSHVHFRRA